MNLSTDLAGKIVVVTGAGAGIGRASSLLFARNGCTLIAVDVDESAVNDVAGKARKMGAQAEAFRADVSDAAAVHTEHFRGLCTKAYSMFADNA